MTAAYRLRGLGWLASCSAAVLGFYLVSLQVASERNALDALNNRIRAAERDVRALETEFDTRANMQQLERWNGDVLALSAPTARQFLRDERQFASMGPDLPPVDPTAPVMKTAALVVPTLHQAAPQTPVAVAQAVVRVPAPVRDPVAPARAAPRVSAPAVVRVAAVRDPEAPKLAARAVPAVARAVAATPVRMQRVAMLDRELLSGDTFGDLMKGARAEAGRRR